MRSGTVSGFISSLLGVVRPKKLFDLLVLPLLHRLHFPIHVRLWQQLCAVAIDNKYCKRFTHATDIDTYCSLEYSKRHMNSATLLERPQTFSTQCAPHSIGSSSATSHSVKEVMEY